MNNNINLKSIDVREDIFSVMDSHLAYLYVTSDAFCNVIEENRRGLVASKFRVKIESLTKSSVEVPAKRITQYLVTYHTKVTNEVRRCIISWNEVESILLNMYDSGESLNADETMLVNWYKGADISSYYYDIIKKYLLITRAKWLDKYREYSEGDLEYSYALLVPKSNTCNLGDCTFFIDFKKSQDNTPTGNLYLLNPNTYKVANLNISEYFKSVPYYVFNKFNTRLLDVKYDFHFKSSKDNDVYSESIYAFEEPMRKLEEVVDGVRTILSIIGTRSSIKCQAPESESFEKQVEINRDASVGLYDTVVEGTGEKFSKALGNEYYKFKKIINQSLANTGWIKESMYPIVDISSILNEKGELRIEEVTRAFIESALEKIDTLKHLKSIDNEEDSFYEEDTWEDGTPVAPYLAEFDSKQYIVKSFL